MPKRDKWMGKEACGIWSTTCTFLAGMFFTCILLLVQERERFEYSFTVLGTEVEAIILISVPLTISFVTFLFAAITFADTAISGKMKLEDAALTFFTVGFFSSFGSLVFILLQIGLGVAFFGFILCLVATIFWIKRS